MKLLIISAACLAAAFAAPMPQEYDPTYDEIFDDNIAMPSFSEQRTVNLPAEFRGADSLDELPAEQRFIADEELGEAIESAALRPPSRMPPGQKPFQFFSPDQQFVRHQQYQPQGFNPYANLHRPNNGYQQAYQPFASQQGFQSYFIPFNNYDYPGQSSFNAQPAYSGQQGYYGQSFAGQQGFGGQGYQGYAPFSSQQYAAPVFVPFNTQKPYFFNQKPLFAAPASKPVASPVVVKAVPEEMKAEIASANHQQNAVNVVALAAAANADDEKEFGAEKEVEKLESRGDFDGAEILEEPKEVAVKFEVAEDKPADDQPAAASFAVDQPNDFEGSGEKIADEIVEKLGAFEVFMQELEQVEDEPQAAKEELVFVVDNGAVVGIASDDKPEVIAAISEPAAVEALVAQDKPESEITADKPVEMEKIEIIAEVQPEIRRGAIADFAKVEAPEKSVETADQADSEKIEVIDAASTEEEDDLGFRNPPEPVNVIDNSKDNEELKALSVIGSLPISQ